MCSAPQFDRRSGQAYEVQGGLTHGNAPVILGATEHALDGVTVLVSLFVEGVGLLSVFLVGNDGLDVPAQQTGAPMVGILGLVGKPRSIHHL